MDIKELNDRIMKINREVLTLQLTLSELQDDVEKFQKEIKTMLDERKGCGTKET